MNAKRSSIAGFRVTRHPGKHRRPMAEHRPVRLSEARRLLDAIVSRELRHRVVRIMRTSAIEQGEQVVAASASRPKPVVFNVGRIDLAKCRLPLISDAEAEAMARRETLSHFGQDPDS
ncbi:hypothetical protein [Burkholderia territorii]|uniref:Uncharacterized protein n=2 Tax=Burkholderia territorii TaxID=1503055 RepID=A0A6L3NC24_9BURK|nr:hypothetical protein [Burkholderia territorii]KAB0660493.1 hypothetical protein F7R13_22490 [Burkholderia territorii]MBM2775147.1 hypothetical protein [Burkholderia territorii]VWB24285.1 hypothetical protein BTE28158_00998 [Burkholderia territorii]